MEFITRKKRKLTGKRLETFNQFWDVFNYKKGKAEAADSWLDIPVLTNAIVADIMLGAKNEAIQRPGLVQAGRTPKMAQGWITARRWEDEVTASKPVVHRQTTNGIQNMARAFNLLCNYPEKFDDFCRHVGMAPGDIEAVRNKHSGSYDIRNLARGIG